MTEDDVSQIVSAWPSYWLTSPTEGVETEQVGTSGVKTSTQMVNKDTKKYPKHITFATNREFEKKLECDIEKDALETGGVDDTFMDLENSPSPYILKGWQTLGGRGEQKKMKSDSSTRPESLVLSEG